MMLAFHDFWNNTGSVTSKLHFKTAAVKNEKLIGVAVTYIKKNA